MKTGDVVYSRMSGVPMTVESCNAARVTCIWFGINARADWTGPHSKQFRRGDLASTEAAARRSVGARLREHAKRARAHAKVPRAAGQRSRKTSK